MSEFLNTVSEETKRAADKFIERIKNGLITKRTLPNIAEDFDIDKASKRFSSFVTSKHFENIVKNAYRKKSLLI